jgi:NADH:ubiquinone oxidoreductase subunit 6 (subunit J)
MDIQLTYFLMLMFSTLMMLGSIMVISSPNPVHSVLYLVFVFCNASALFILLSTEFLAIIFMIVYVGAIAILFLFVIMMLNIRIVELNENLLRYLPLGGFIGLIFLLEILLVLDVELGYEIPKNLSYEYIDWAKHINDFTNIEQIGQVLYTNYFYAFIIASLILLVAMIGAIVLTLHSQSTVKKQDTFKQTSRHISRSIVLKR